MEPRPTEAQAAAQREFFGRTKHEGETRERYEFAIRELAARCDFGTATESFVNCRVSCEFPVEVSETQSPIVAEDNGTTREATDSSELPDPTASFSGVTTSHAENSGGSAEVSTEGSTLRRWTLKQEKVQTGAIPKVRNAKQKQQSSGTTPGAADGAGVDFECHMQTLIFLRMLFQCTLFKGLEFELASNKSEAGKFDDIILKHRKDSKDDWDASYLQLKIKKNNSIQKADLLGISSAFSLVNYCDSYETIKSSREFPNNHKIIIFTNAGMADCLVNEIVNDPLLITNGKAVSFKADSDIYEGLCELVAFKKALKELLGQTGLSAETIRARFPLATPKNLAVSSWTKELIATPTVDKINELLTKLKPVRDEATYASFLSKLQVYVNQTKESKLEEKIKKELAKLWHSSAVEEADKMLRGLIDGVKSFRLNSRGGLTRESSLWLNLVKSQTDKLSKCTIDPLTAKCVAFEEDSLSVLHEAIPPKGLVNVRVVSRTAASSLRVHQALAKFRENENVLHVNLQALFKPKNNNLAAWKEVLVAWKTSWCRVLVLECDEELEQSKTERIGGEILKILGRDDNDKLLVLIAPGNHRMNVLLQRYNSYQFYDDSCGWSDLTDDSKKCIFGSSLAKIQGSEYKLSELTDEDKERFGELADLEIISQLLTGVTCGKELAKEEGDFVQRRLRKSNNEKSFAVGPVRELAGKVFYVVAEAGMGKTRLMTHLANRAKAEDSTAWIVHVKLNDCSTYLKNLDMDKLDEDAAKNFLEHFSLLNPGNNLEKFLFWCLEHKLFVFLDGVDEVCPDYQQQVFSLLAFMKTFEFAKLWVASRSLSQNQLETFYLEPLPAEGQAELFSNVWKEKGVSDAGCREKNDKLWAFLATLPDKDSEMLGVPLIAAMVAEVYHKYECKLVKNGRLDKTFLYKNYVQQRLEVEFTEKMETRNVNSISVKRDKDKRHKEILSNHCLAALRALYGNADIVNLQFGNDVNFDDDLAQFLNDVTVGYEKIGIIEYVIDGKPVFTHRSLSEYLVAVWLKENFKENKDFTKKITSNSAFSLISEMFSQLLAEGHSLHSAVLNRDVEETERLLTAQSEPCDVNELDAGGRTALHLAVLLSGTDCHEDYNTIVETLVHKHKARIDIADKITDWTPLQYAEQIHAWKALDIILEIGVECKKAWPKPDPHVMLDAARGATVRVLRYLVEKRCKERCEDLRCRGPEGETMVHIAAKRENDLSLKYLADKGLFLHDRDKSNNTVLHYATYKDNVLAIRFLLSHEVDFTVTNSRGLTAFHEAAERGAYQVMAVLLNNGASATVTEFDKLSRDQCNASLLCAAFAGDQSSVEHVISHGSYYRHYRDEKDHTAAWVAMHRGHLGIMNFLLLLESEEGETPLHGACRSGDREIVLFLLSQPGVDIDAKGPNGRTPLHETCRGWDLAMAKLLLSNGASVESRDNDVNTPLHTASFWGKELVVDLLLRHGASIDDKNRKGQTPLECAYNSATVELLLASGADVHCRDGDGNTPLHTASRQGWKGAVEALLRLGVAKDKKNKHGKSALHCAAEGDKTQVIEVLLSKKAAVGCRDNAGNTPLHAASSRGSELAVELLLRFWAKRDARNKKGETPLHCASRAGSPAVLELLLSPTDEMESRDKRGNTPLHAASYMGWKQAVETLLRHGAKRDAVNHEGQSPLDVAMRACQANFKPSPLVEQVSHLLKTEVRNMVPSEEYPFHGEVFLDSSEKFVPEKLRYFMQLLLDPNALANDG